MKIKKINIILFLIFFSFSGSIYAQLSGVNTINPLGVDNSGTNPNGVSGKNYLSFTQAVTALSNFGINSPVIFDVASGTYLEQISIPEIPNASELFTITFQSQVNDSNAVILRYNPTSGGNYVVRLDGADHIRFRKMTIENTSGTINYGRVIKFETGTSSTIDIIIENNVLNGNTNVDANTADEVIHQWAINSNTGGNIIIRNNCINNGNYGVYLGGNAYQTGNIIENNIIKDYYHCGAFGEYQNAIQIIGNECSGISSYPTGQEIGVGFYECINSCIIANNKITGNNGFKNTGIYIGNSNDAATNPILIYNNMVISSSGSASNYGIYNESAVYANIYHNTVKTNGLGAAFCIDDFYGKINLLCTIKNNVFINSGGDYAICLSDISTPSFIVECDYNLYYSSGTNFAQTGWSNDYANLLTWQVATNFDNNSFIENPPFITIDDLHINPAIPTRIESNGVNVGILDDIDEDARSNPPDIGADEGAFTPFVSPLCGDYTISSAATTFPSGNNFQTFGEAVTALNIYGISCSVKFTIATGIYNEQITINNITGASDANTITFQSETGMSGDVLLQTNSSTNNWVVKLAGTNHIRFYNMSFKNYSTALDYGRVFYFDNNFDMTDIILQGNDIIGRTDIFADSPFYSTIYFNSIANKIDFVKIIGNKIIGGSWGVYLINNGVIPFSNILIIENDILDFLSCGIQANYQNNFEIRNNRLLGKDYNIDQYGIILRRIGNNSFISKNKISLETNSTVIGFDMYDCIASNSEPLILDNNSIIINASYDAYAIYNINSSYNYFYNNSISISNSVVSYCMYLNNATNSNYKIQNNIFLNISDGYIFYFDNSNNSYVNTCNNNLFYQQGNIFGKIGWTTDFPTLADWQSEGFDLNSYEGNPNFIDPTNDLHINNLLPSWAESRGADLNIDYDIDGNLRAGAVGYLGAGTAPDIGADEIEGIPEILPPKNLTCIQGFGEIFLTWNQSSEPNFIQYNIYVSENADFSFPIYTASNLLVDDTTEWCTGLQYGTVYYLGVTAVNSYGIESAPIIINASPLNTTIAGFGSSLSFDGFDDEMIIPDKLELRPQNTDFSIEMWVNLKNEEQTTIIYEKAEYSGNFNQIGLWVNGADGYTPTPGRRICFTLIQDATNQLSCYTANDIIIDENWHHIAAVADASNNQIKIFVDGIQVDIIYDPNNVGSWPNVNNSEDVRIMCDNTLSGFEHSEGKIDELRMWNYAISKNDIRKRMYKPLNGSEIGLIGLWRFDENDGNYVFDFSGNENHGHLFNSPAWTFPGAPIRIVTKNNQTFNGILYGYDYNGDVLDFTLTNSGTIGTANITNSTTGAAEYLRNVYDYDLITYKVSAGIETQEYNVEIVPVLYEKGVLENDLSTINWLADTVKILGDVYLENEKTLNIHDDTYIEFEGFYSINVQGTVNALAYSDTIIFNIYDNTNFTNYEQKIGAWNGIKFDNTPINNDTSYFFRCFFEYSKATDALITASEDDNGGVFYINNFSKVQILSSTFAYNYASEKGGAIYCSNSEPIIKYCRFGANSSKAGGAFNFQNSSPQVINNLIFNNNAVNGGAFYLNSSNPVFYNNTIADNTANFGAGGYYETNSSPNIYNTILYNNTASNSGNEVFLADDSSDPNFYYSDIEGLSSAFGIASGTYTGILGADNIDSAPLFIDAAANNYNLEQTTLCRNAGNPATEILTYNFPYDLNTTSRIKECIIDIGAYEVFYVIPGYDVYWIGCESNDWHNGRNWSTGSVPTITDRVLIPGTAIVQPIVQNANANCYSVDIDVTNGAFITINAGFKLNVGF